MNISHYISPKNTLKVLIALFIIACANGNILPTTPAEAAYNDGTYTLLAPLPCITKNADGSCATGNGSVGNGQEIKKVDFESYATYVVNLVIALSAVTAVLMIVYGGFEYVTSTIPGIKSDGLKRVKNAVLGLLLVLCSYIILKTIDPRLVEIPTTIVPALDCPGDSSLKINDAGCSVNKNALADQFNMLQTLSNNADAKNEQINQQLRDNQKAYDQQQQVGDSLAQQIADKTGYNASDVATVCSKRENTSEVSDLCLEWYKNQDAEAATRASSQLAVYKGQMNDYLNGYLKDPANYDYDGSMAKVKSLYDQQHADLVQSGATPQQLDDLNNAESTTIAGLGLAKAVNFVNETGHPGAGAVQLVQDSVADINSIKDPTLRAQEAQTALQTIDSMGASFANDTKYGDGDGHTLTAKQYFDLKLQTQITQLQGYVKPAATTK